MLTYTLTRPKTRALYSALRRDIIRGVFPCGTRLPSKRQIASDLHISLSTVENALSLLEEEGYIEAKNRSGMYVLPLPAFGKNSLPETDGQSAFALELLEEDPPVCDPSFPLDLWHKTMRRVMSLYPRYLSMKSPAKGAARLRNVIAAYLRSARGMDVQPRQIIIASGTEMLYERLAFLFAPDFSIAIESPGYAQIEAVYASHGARIEKLPMEKDGINPAALARSTSRFLHVTPFCSYPSGITASAARRKDYLAWTADPKRCGYLIEDDFNSEFYRSGPPARTLYSMDQTGRVIYLNTFSRALSPSLRLGYMVLPESLLPLYEEKAGFFSSTLTMLEQYTLAEFIENGSFERLINRRRRAQAIQKETSHTAA